MTAATAVDTNPFESWFNLGELAATPLSAGSAIPLFRKCLQQGNASLAEHFARGASVPDLIRGRSWLVDQILLRAWTGFMGTAQDSLALVAVGGYGRSELMPGSDIDLLLLLPDTDNHRYDSNIESLLTFLWDIGLEVGHSVRNISDCIEQSLSDITVATNLMEARLLAGSGKLFRRMRESTRAPEIWDSRDFFTVKCREQQARYHKYDETAYRLEPNIKEGPGGLRDIQMIAWVANRHFGTASLEELVDRSFLTHDEFRTLIDGRNHLWRIRFALHTLTGRGEDRLLFDYQRTLAQTLGFHDDENRLGVEAFMKQYYRTIMELSRLNEMLLQLFHEEILHPEGPGEPVVLNKRFHSCDGYLEVIDRRVFSYQPFAMLEMFLLLEQHSELQGVRADTIRAVREHRHLIDDDFRNDIRNRSLFMEIIRQPHGITRELRRMSRYGVLAAYLPEFGQIVGLMQYDLFHVYTVDEHILFVVRNLRRFTVPEFANEYPLCSHVTGTLPKIELLYLAALFHDIAKGRGGDHSELGAADAREFCIRHDLGNYDTELVAWLVRWHLLMSSTAQRKDISDPDIINSFARIVGDTIHLDYLYLLTVADIRATNPDMWNAWRDSLLKQLYYNTRRALQRGLQEPLERMEHIRQVQDEAMQLLGSAPSGTDVLWEQLGDEYFLRHTPGQVAHHTQLLTHAHGSGRSIVDIRPLTERGGTEIFIYTPDRDGLFSRITAVLDQLGLNVVDASIFTTGSGYILDTFQVLEESSRPVEEERRIREIQAALQDEINMTDRREWHVSRRTPHHYRHFPVSTRIDFQLDDSHGRTIMELVTADRPGLLSRVGRAFADCKIRLLNAKIATLGSRAEDVYYITDLDNRPLREESQFQCLDRAIRKYLDPEASDNPFD
ncbi:MAG: [protein-PII] uridylyltransferase [Gammaproteobacteria bacterium]|jgi:[protein-PII] uridylyltransferase